MDTIFENSYIRTKEQIKEIYQHFYFKSPVYIFFDVLFGLAILAKLVISIFEHYLNLSVILAISLFFILQVFLYFKSVKIMYKRDEEIAGGKEVHVDVIVTNDYIRNTNSTGGVSEITFDKIKKVIQTKNLILLRSEANLIYIFSKDSFIKGNAADFLAFLSQKGLKVKQ